MEGVYLVFMLILYFLPTIVAGCRDHKNTTGIAILNALTGWSGIGWCASLVLAVWK